MKEPASVASLHGTPSNHASGETTHPRSFSKVRSPCPNQPPMPPRMPLAIAISATKAMSRPPTVTAILPPAMAPRPMASMALADSSSRTARTSILPGEVVPTDRCSSRSVAPGCTVESSGSGVESGHMILAISSPAGAFITVAASRYSSGAPSNE